MKDVIIIKRIVDGDELYKDTAEITGADMEEIRYLLLLLIKELMDDMIK